MNSLQQAIGHGQGVGALPLLGNAGCLFLVLVLTLSVALTFARAGLQPHDYQPVTGRYYEDADGVAGLETRKLALSRITIFLHVTLVVANAAISLTGACISSRQGQMPAVEVWLKFATAILLVFQAAALCAPVPPTTRYRLGLHNGLSCTATAATYCIQLYTQYPRGGLQPCETALSSIQLLLLVAAAICALLLERRPDVFHDGKAVDRQNAISFLGWLSFSWALPLLQASKQHERLDFVHLRELDHDTRAAGLYSSFTSIAADQETPRLWYIILRSHGWPLITQVILSLASSLLAFVPRLALLGLLNALDSDMVVSGDHLRLWSYVAILGISSVLSNIVTTWKSWVSINIISLRVYAQLTSAIYAKSMRLTTRRRHDEDDTGAEVPANNMVNTMANDANGIASFVGESYQLLDTPIRLLGCLLLLLRLLGWQSVLAGLVVVVLSSPVQGYVVKLAMSATLRMLESRDERMTMLSELIYGIRQVKFLATEKSWEKRINDLRDQEVHAASRTIVQNVFMSSLYLAQPILLSVVMLSVYSFTQPQLSAATGFTSVTILSITEQAMDILPMLQMRFVNVFLFARRIESYLQLPEREPYIETSNHFELVNATICWPGCRPMSGVKPTSGLHNVNLCFPNGKLSVIVGPTGVGKSLLLSCLIGECELISGAVRAPTCKQHVYSHQRPALNWIVDNTVAYVAQTAWIEAGTIRDNIIFGSPFLANRYHEVLYACALDTDLDLLSDGDMTQVGASGVNLSGGQKSRLSLARALYSRASTLILDDIFSAVDVHTGKHLYEHALTGPLVEGRTRILATYQVELCRSGADYLVTIDAQGGCHDTFVDETQLIDVNNIEPEYSQVAAIAENEVNPVNYSRTKQRQSISSQILSLDEGFSYGETETVRPSLVIDGGQTGSVQWKTAQDFAKFSGNMYYWFAVFALFIAYGALALGRGYAMRLWTSQSNKVETADYNSHLYLILYTVISAAAIVVGTLRIYMTLSSTLRGSEGIFRHLLHNLLWARLRWLDTIPVGNLLSRFSADCAVVDLQIGNSLKQLLFFAVGILTAILSGAIEAPRLFIFGLLLIAICFWCARDYVIAARQLKRLQSSAMGPMLDHLSSSAAGISTIRAFGREDRYIEGFLSKVDVYSRSFWHLWLLNRWMCFWMNIVGAVFFTTTAVCMLSIPHMEAAAIGLAISFTMQLGDYLVNAIQAYTAFEMDMNSVHRLLEYTDIELENDDGQDPPPTWPVGCRLEVSNLEARYALDLPPVLHGVTFDVDTNQRIGVVGRTGAGKSSLSLALMRFLEVKGDVRIDGVDVSSIPLHRLRRVINLIPQSPVLFSGTIRSNLDSENRYEDADLVSVLDSVGWLHNRPSDISHATDSTIIGSNTCGQAIAHADTEQESTTSTLLDDTEPNSPTKPSIPLSHALQLPISEGGSNLSPGERQLLCLARAMLCKPKMLILDESTSSVDKSADEKIQQSIRSQFRQSSTLIVIAHRLRTIVDFDRILVLDQGRVAEFGTPSQLLKIEGGFFRGLVEEDAERSVLEGIICHNSNSEIIDGS